MEIEAPGNQVIFEISNRHIQLGCWRSLRRVRKSRKFTQKKSAITAHRGLDSQQCEGREDLRKNVFLLIIKTAKFPAYAAILLFYFDRPFVTSYGWGCSHMYVSAKSDECSDYFSWPYTHLFLVFSPSYAFSYCFLSDEVPRKLHMGSHLRCRVIIFRYKIDPCLKCISLFSLFVFTYTGEQADENLSTIRSIKKQNHTNKNATSISILFLDVRQITIIGVFVLFSTVQSMNQIFGSILFSDSFFHSHILKLIYFLFLILIWCSVFLTQHSLFSCFSFIVHLNYYQIFTITYTNDANICVRYHLFVYFFSNF